MTNRIAQMKSVVRPTEKGGNEVESKSAVEESSFRMNYYRRTTKIAAFLGFVTTFLVIVLLFRLISSLFVVLEHALDFLKKAKLMEAEGEMKLRSRTVPLERRRYPRFDVDLPVRYNKTNSSMSRNGRVMNLSQSGMLIQSHDQMEIGHHLKSTFSLVRGSEFCTVEMLAEVVWQDICMNEAWGDYRYGLKFLDISAGDKNRLDNFLITLS